MPPGVGCSVATVAVADAVEDHPRLRFEDCRTDLFPEPVSGDADGRFDRLEEVEVGVPRGQLVGDGLDQVACPRTRLREVAEDDGLDGAEAVVGPDQRPRVRRSRAVAVLPWSRGDAVELLLVSDCVCASMEVAVAACERRAPRSLSLTACERHRQFLHDITI